MKKTLLAIAALAATTAASAQSSVTVFGVIDAAFTRDGGSVASVSGLSAGNSASSRLGFRGIEDLGGGLKAGFWLEAGLLNDSGAGTTNSSTNNVTASTVANSLQFGRRATVSLIGNFGELRLGRDFVPSYYNDTFSPFGVTSIGTDVVVQSNLIGQSQQRTSNGIHYFLPSTLGGFYGHFHYALGEQPSNVVPAAAEDDGNYAGLRLGYKGGPVDVAFAYGKADLVRSPSGLNNDRSIASIAGSYDLGAVKLTGEYSVQKIKNTVGAGFGNGGTASSGNDTEGKAFGLGAIVPVGNGVVKVAYSRIEVENGHGLGTEPRASKLALGYVYNLSKRTALYTSVARLKNANGTAGGATLTTAAVRVAGISGAVAGPNSSSTGFEAGIRHSF
ncbi:MAG: porin [Pseudomonadota bacterium]